MKHMKCPAQWKLLVFILGIAALAVLPHTETVIFNIFDTAGRLILLVRGLVAFYGDFEAALRT
jgi:hypothetical protein